MDTLFHAMSVDPTTVTAEDLVAICAEFDLNTAEPAPADFFQAGNTYANRYDVFSCALVAWQWNGVPVALGYAPINLAGIRTWEIVFASEADWKRTWAEDPSAAPVPSGGPALTPFLEAHEIGA